MCFLYFFTDEKCTEGIDTISAPRDTSSTGSDDNGNDNIAVSKGY